jgi:hypothetical protein
MSENAANDRAGRSLASSQASGPPIRETSHGLSGPHYAPPSPRVLARVPDLESAELDAADTMPRRRRDGRILGSGPSMKVLAAAGALLLVLALGLPLLFRDRGGPDTTATDEVSAWDTERSASSASEAPAWGGLADGGPNRQSSLGGPALGQSAGTQPSPWGGAVPAQAWDAQSNSTPWTGQPGSQPPWNPALGQSAPPAWDGQAGPPGTRQPGSGEPPALGWNGRPSPAPGVYPQSDNSWPEPARTPSWQAPPYGESAGAPAERVSPVDTSSLPSALLNADAFSPAAVSNRAVDAAVSGTPSTGIPAYDPSRPAGSAYEASSPLDPHRQPQATTNRSVRIGEAPPAAAFQSGTNRQWGAEPAYRAADTRAGYPPLGNSQSDYPSPGTPATSRPAYGYGATYPEAGAGAARGYDARASLGPRYGDRTYPSYPSYSEPGVARFQGGIEKPTGTETYDRNRSGVY